MEIYAIRHGIAVAEAPSDAERWLTPKGIRRTSRVAHRYRKVFGAVDMLLTSPLVRAQQTAQILVAAKVSHQLEICDFLAPGGAIESWLTWLESYRQAQPQAHRIALVGHNPDLAQWCEKLVFGQVVGRLQLKKAGLIAIEAPDSGALWGNCTLQGVIQPRHWH